MGNPAGAMRRAGMLASVLVLVLVMSSSIATASGNLGTTILGDTLPGFVAQPPGIRNGPLTPSAVSLFGSADQASSSALPQALQDGQASAYIRVWTHVPADGDGIVIIAVRFADSTQVGPFLDGVLQGQPARSTSMAIPGVTGAVGYRTLNENGAANDYAAAFGKSDTGYLVEMVTGSQTLTPNDAVGLVQRQAAAVSGVAVFPSTPQQSAAYRVGQILGVLILLVLVIGVPRELIRRRRRPKPLGDVPWPGQPLTPAAPCTPTDAEPTPGPGM